MDSIIELFWESLEFVTK